MTTYRQSIELYQVPFRNLASVTMPPFGVGLITAGSVDGGGLFLPSIADFASSEVVGMLVNGPSEVPSGEYGAGYWGLGPVLALYDTADGNPAVGETWGIKYNPGVNGFKLRKGYLGFTCVSGQTAGSGDDARGFFIPSWQVRPAIVAGLRRASFTITNADSATQILPLNSPSFGANGEWPSLTLEHCIDLDTGTGRATIRRSGLWKVDATWSSESPPRFTAPFQSKTQRVGLGLYKNASRSGVSGGFSDYYHFSLANADTSPSSGIAMRVNGALSTALYCESGDVLDLRVTISEVTADSGTTSEGHVTFVQCEARFEFVGSQQWRNDY